MIALKHHDSPRGSTWTCPLLNTGFEQPSLLDSLGEMEVSQVGFALIRIQPSKYAGFWGLNMTRKISYSVTHIGVRLKSNNILYPRCKFHSYIFLLACLGCNQLILFTRCKFTVHLYFLYVRIKPNNTRYPRCRISI